MSVYDRFGRPAWRGGYDRGVYGGAYEGYRGEYLDRGGWRGDRGVDYGAGYPGGTFIPREAYARHPELDRPPHPRGPRWGYELDDVGAELDDRAIRSAVRRRIYEDVWVDVEGVKVEVEDGVVTLRGEVDDWMEARYAWDDAWETEGVRGVVNHLVVRSGEARARPHGDLLPQSAPGSAPEPG